MKKFLVLSFVLLGMTVHVTQSNTKLDCDLWATETTSSYDCPNDRLTSTWDLECTSGANGCSGYIATLISENVCGTWVPVTYGADCVSVNMDCGTQRLNYTLYIDAVCANLPAGQYKVDWSLYNGGACGGLDGAFVDRTTTEFTITHPCGNCITCPK